MADTLALPTEQTRPLPRFFSPLSNQWEDFALSPSIEFGGATQVAGEGAVRERWTVIRNMLLSSMQMQHVVVLAGSGTSLGPVVNGPSMWDLWDYSVNSNPGTGNDERKLSTTASKVIKEVSFKLDSDSGNIEALLSQCEAYLQIKDAPVVVEFVRSTKGLILSKCSDFLKDPEHQLEAHRMFLHRLSRRRVRDSRLKLFTTNYDTCFEDAASKLGLVVIDGFSFAQRRHFDPRFFGYDVVRRPRVGDEHMSYLEGVFHLYKLHGSVNWARDASGVIWDVRDPSPEDVCMVFPARGKYQQSYVQPHLELMSQFLAALREPNTCVVVLGFGFNDAHLAEPIIAAAGSNPHLRVLVVDPSAEKQASYTSGANSHWSTLYGMSQRGDDVWFINSTFKEFAMMLPDLRTLTPAQRLAKDIHRIVEEA